MSIHSNLWRVGRAAATALVIGCAATTALADDLPTCDLSSVGSTVVTTSRTQETGKCVGTDCKGKQLQIDYAKVQDTENLVLQCRLRPSGYRWMRVCEYGTKIRRFCHPQTLPCANCDLKKLSYWTRPVVTTDAWDYDTCRARSGSKGLGELIQHGKDQLAARLAADEAAYGSKLSLIDQQAAVSAQATCVAEPVSALAIDR